MRRSFINDKNSGELALEYVIERGVTAGLRPLATSYCNAVPRPTVPLEKHSHSVPATVQSMEIS